MGAFRKQCVPHTKSNTSAHVGHLTSNAMESEDHIRELCDRLLATDDSEQATRVAAELRDAIHDHLENLKQNVRYYGPRLGLRKIA